jgi:tRNA G46 methylase TrmB
MIIVQANQTSHDKEVGMSVSEKKHRLGEAKQPKNRAKSRERSRLSFKKAEILGPERRRFGPPERIIGPFVRKAQVVADLGCGPGYYTLALAESVGPEGKVYAVDLYEKFIQALRKKVNKAGYRNIELHPSSVTDVSFIPDRSVDFVFANGLL